MTYPECVALNPNAPAIYCLTVSGDMGASGVTPPPIAIDPSWNLPSALQMATYTNAQGYTFVIKRILGKLEYFAINIVKRELINFSSLTMVKKFFGVFSSPNQIAPIDYIVLPPNVPFGLLALASVNKNKIVRIVPGTSDIFEVVGYPPAFASFNTLPAPVYTPPDDGVDNYNAPPPRYVPDLPGYNTDDSNDSEDLIPGGEISNKNFTPLLIAGGLLLLILK